MPRSRVLYPDKFVSHRLTFIAVEPDGLRLWTAVKSDDYSVGCTVGEHRAREVIQVLPNKPFATPDDQRRRGDLLALIALGQVEARINSDADRGAVLAFWNAIGATCAF